MPEQTSRIVLGALLLSPELLESTDELTSSLFTGREQKTFEAIADIWHESRPDKVDPVNLANRIGGDDAFSYLSDLLDGAAIYAAQPDWLKNHIADLVKKRLANTIAKTIYEQAKHGEIDMDEVRPLLVKYDCAGDKDRRLAESVRSWINNTIGEFDVKDIYSELGVQSIAGKANVRQTIGRMVQEGLLKPALHREGRYRVPTKLSQPIDLVGTTATPLDIYLPLGINDLIHIYPKSVIVCAGEGQQGKTALALDVVKNNMAKHDVKYFFSEGGPEELRSRLERHQGIGVCDWTMDAYEHNGNPADVIDPDAFNVYDYLYVPEPFYVINDILQEVHKKLRRGMAWVNIQKNRNKELGDGGDFSLRIPRLYMTLMSDQLVSAPAPDLQYVVAKIIKAKGWKQKLNPDGRIMPFSISEGWEIRQRCSSWEFAASHEVVRKKKIF